MPRIHWVARGTGIPKDRDEVNGREVLLWFLFLKMFVVILFFRKKKSDKIAFCVTSFASRAGIPAR